MQDKANGGFTFQDQQCLERPGNASTFLGLLLGLPSAFLLSYSFILSSLSLFLDSSSAVLLSSSLVFSSSLHIFSILIFSTLKNYIKPKMQFNSYFCESPERSLILSKFGHIRHSCCCFAPVLVLKNIEWILRVGWISGCFVKRMGKNQPGGESGPRWPPAVHRCLREVRRLSRKLCSNGRQTHSNWKKGFIDMVLGMIFVRWEIEDWGVSWIWRGEKRERC